METNATPELRKHADWSSEYDVQVLNPNGLHEGSSKFPRPKDWETPVTKDEYVGRLYTSTIIGQADILMQLFDE